ncbi:hydroxymethylglutaryl-CoA synthase [Nocardia brasiliensis]|uniref:hydroxymethylglutaryl-CoA synthase n=1 Tax=Nocardia brasiliensis TaxID=37326 RepID=UPI0004A72419|nr:hydroxymethylglutaryl-CoA synthase [Nocardia brasiliensis]
MTVPVNGIHDLSFATTQYCLSIDRLAEHHGQPAEKFTKGLGQQTMSVPAPDEDIVTMAATAAAPILERHGTGKLRAVLLATETGVDESKAAALYLHDLIGLPATARVVELKQACYAGTAALQFASGLVTKQRGDHVLVIATDIARYDLDTPAEPTQGAAAVAMLIATDPDIARLEPISGVHSADIMDFWRPAYRSTAVVDGKFSREAYLSAIEKAYADYAKQGGRALSEFRAYCYHQPFTKMSNKAHRHLLKSNEIPFTDEDIEAAVGHTIYYNQHVGNSYNASLYLALASLLDHGGDLTDQPIALVSYGSGCVAEFFAVTAVPGYRDHLRTTSNQAAIARRAHISYSRYRELHHIDPPRDGSDYLLPEETSGPYRLVGYTGHQRIYETKQRF